jgi:hypothetical protein
MEESKESNAKSDISPLTTELFIEIKTNDIFVDDIEPIFVGSPKKTSNEINHFYCELFHNN